MIKEVNVKYCETNGKFDVLIDGKYMGKHYTMAEALINTGHRVQMFNEKVMQIKNAKIKKKN